MTRSLKAALATLGIISLSACSKAEAPLADTAAAMAPSAAPATTAADQEAVKAVNVAWFKAYNAHDVNALSALYADDAVLSAPGVPTARGVAAIKEVYGKDLAAAAKAGISNNLGNDGEVGASGDLAWEANTFTVTDKSGKTLDKGKYVTVFERKNGKWMIIRDIWNSDGPPAK